MFDRVTKVLLSLLVAGVWALLFQALFHFPQALAEGKDPDNGYDTQQVIRTRGVIIVDEQNRERIILGRPGT